MVKDILLDVNECDILLADTSSSNEPCFDVEWSGSVCKILVPSAYSSLVKYTDGEFVCKCIIPYKPLNSVFTIVVYVGGTLSTTISGGEAKSYLFGALTATTMKACQLPVINHDFVYRVQFVSGKSCAFVYSGESMDLAIGPSDNQSAQLLSLCAPGKNYRYPTLGVDITRYVNTVVGHTDIQKRLREQFLADNKNLYDAAFDSDTGEVSTTFSPESESADDDWLTPVSELDLAVLN